MEIEFNASRGPNTGANAPVTKRTEPTPVQGEVSLDRTEALKRSVQGLPLIRPDQVDRARALVADVKYPPQEMLNRIANLLALHMSK
jgi:hypothetical protein